MLASLASTTSRPTRDGRLWTASGLARSFHQTTRATPATPMLRPTPADTGLHTSADRTVTPQPPHRWLSGHATVARSSGPWRQAITRPFGTGGPASGCSLGDKRPTATRVATGQVGSATPTDATRLRRVRRLGGRPVLTGPASPTRDRRQPRPRGRQWQEDRRGCGSIPARRRPGGWPENRSHRTGHLPP